MKSDPYNKKKPTYSDKLKHPKWQRKRLEILTLANWRCEFCGAEDRTLNIHHIKYRGYIDPWKYENDEMIVLCDSHHWVVHLIPNSEHCHEACRTALHENRQDNINQLP